MTKETQFEPHDARAVANKILQIAWRRALNITNMQLIKLVYIANGWWMAWEGSSGKPLVKEHAVAWRYGPVYPSVYRAFRKYRMAVIADLAIHPQIGTEYMSRFCEDEIELLEQTVDVYGQYSAFQLSKKTHDHGTPWSNAFKKGRDTIIKNEDIKAHFDELKQRLEEL